MRLINYSIAVFAVTFAVSPANSRLAYNEHLSVSLIEDVDRSRRSIFDELNDNVVDHHGHSGEEDVTSSRPSKFTNEWVVEITGGANGARALAEEMGYDVIGQVLNI